MGERQDEVISYSWKAIPTRCYANPTPALRQDRKTAMRNFRQPRILFALRGPSAISMHESKIHGSQSTVNTLAMTAPFAEPSVGDILCTYSLIEITQSISWYAVMLIHCFDYNAY